MALTVTEALWGQRSAKTAGALGMLVLAVLVSSTGARSARVEADRSVLRARRFELLNTRSKQRAVFGLNNSSVGLRFNGTGISQINGSLTSDAGDIALLSLGTTLSSRVHVGANSDGAMSLALRKSEQGRLLARISGDGIPSLSLSAHAMPILSCSNSETGGGRVEVYDFAGNERVRIQ